MDCFFFGTLQVNTTQKVEGRHKASIFPPLLFSSFSIMTDNNRRLLLLSASRFHDTPYLQHARPLINHFLNPLRNVKHSGLTFVFIAYAGVSLPSFDAYVSKVRKGLGTTVIGEQDKLIGVHSGTPVQVLESADVIMVRVLMFASFSTTSDNRCFTNLFSIY